MFCLPCPTETYSPVKQPSWFFGSLEISEPIMVLTDLLVAAICFYAFAKLRHVQGNQRIKLYLRIYFMGMGMATVLGGVVGHGLIHYLSLEYKLPGWFLSMLSIAVLERACIEVARPHINKRLGQFFAWLNIVELITFVTISYTTLCFFYVEVHSAYGLLIVVTGFSLLVYLKTKHPGSKMMLYGVACAIVAAIAYSFIISIDVWFTHIDLGHVLMAAATVFFYKGARHLIQIDSGQLN